MENHALVDQRYMLFGCNIIKGALNDWRLCEALKERLLLIKERPRRRRLKIQIEDLEEAESFIMSDGLDKLIKMFCLPLDPGCVRGKALKVIRDGKPKRIKTIKASQ